MSKVTAKYQITIPREVREELGIIPGSDVGITKEKNKYVLVVKAVEDIKKKWRGRFRTGVPSNQYMDEIRGRVE
jgi:AbrB family looped-hinge helix DNA binding protein